MVASTANHFGPKWHIYLEWTGDEGDLESLVIQEDTFRLNRNAIITDLERWLAKLNPALEWQCLDH